MRHEYRSFFVARIEKLLDLRSMKVIKKLVQLTDATAGALTMTGAMLINGILERDPAGAGRTDLFPTATDLVAAIKAAGISAFVGMTWEFTLINTADAAETITIGAAPAGGTYIPVSLGTIAQNAAKTFLITITGIATPAYVIRLM